MEMIISITPNFQIHIPKQARKLLGLKKPSKASLKVSDGSIVITPDYNNKLLSLAGKYKSKAKGIKVENIRDIIDYS
ncbi:MAG: hypothetical protein ACD_24C00459G0007 [uncultured bacterium]|uniref:SpoVT-AbrB domain-containing protein n=1 Tax=candidate division WWE3 bacterium RBG_16_37_10 TaxID=1802610 RepID=A0A1F4V4I1_UNCKA|nr:MAG: hypothetical protein ACD_24C00459G0007 [uncultured bacterium]OGC51413.1 MAG: hypothetical protein A2W32_01135 [candidate division WWE3 bacterium RBG_16_37_10]